MSEQQHLDHLSLEALADLLAAEGSEADVDHVVSCAGCAARLAELDEAQQPVAAALAALPAPPLPDGFAARLSAALDAAEPLPASEPRDGPDRPTSAPPPDEHEVFDGVAGGRSAGRTVTPHASRRQSDRRSLPAWLPGAAVAVLVLSAGGLAVSQLGGGGSDESDVSTASGGASDSAAQPESAAAGVVTNESGADYAAGPQVFDQLLPSVLAGQAGPGEAAGLSGPAASGAEQEQDIDASTSVAADGGLERLRDPAALEACLSALVPEDGSVQPLAIDYAAYNGQPALVVVLPTADPASLDVFVVGPSCAPDNDSTLFFTRVDRP